MILNLTNHAPTPDQANAGVVEAKDEETREAIRDIITFDICPDMRLMKMCAKSLARIAIKEGFDKVMIGGAPYFMPILQETLLRYDITPLYAFSKRVGREVTLEDGTVKKEFVFKHDGFVDPTVHGNHF